MMFTTKVSASFSILSASIVSDVFVVSTSIFGNGFESGDTSAWSITVQ